jgi:hypothetical protein
MTISIKWISVKWSPVTILKMKKNQKYLNLSNAVKPALTTTSEQRPPVNNGQANPGQIKLYSSFHWKPSTDRPPSVQRTFFGGPKGSRCVDRLDCTVELSFKELLVITNNYPPLVWFRSKLIFFLVITNKIPVKKKMQNRIYHCWQFALFGMKNVFLCNFQSQFLFPGCYELRL